MRLLAHEHTEIVLRMLEAGYDFVVDVSGCEQAPAHEFVIGLGANDLVAKHSRDWGECMSAHSGCCYASVTLGH